MKPPTSTPSTGPETPSTDKAASSRKTSEWEVPDDDTIMMMHAIPTLDRVRKEREERERREKAEAKPIKRQ